MRSVFDLFLDIRQRCVSSAEKEAPNALLWGWGPTLVERALIDAACRSAGIPFHAALRTNLLKFDAKRLDPHLCDWHPSVLGQPPSSIYLRHVVGLVDTLRQADVLNPVDDVFPESLEGHIRAMGLMYFKIKIEGNVAADVQRVLEVSDVVFSLVGKAARFTLDGNEQYTSMGDVFDFLQRLGGYEQGARLLKHLLLIEQPLSRTITLEPDHKEGIDRVSKIAPVIIDESDSDEEALPRAAALGYGGTSIKNCKGVFRAILNKARCDLSEGCLVLSGEDLTALPVVALQQDLATVGALGLTHVERNGHHYFRAMDHLTVAEVNEALRKHDTLYEPWAGGGRLSIRDGQLDLTSVDCIGFGYAGVPDLAARTLASQWTWT